MCAGVAKPIGTIHRRHWSDMVSRFDLNDKAHDSPLHEPRCHYHPGADDVRLPCPALTPLEVLDRIFLVIEPQLLASS